MNKKVLAIVFIAVLIVGIIAAAFISNNISEKQAGDTSVSDGSEQTTVPPELNMLRPDRLDGMPESDSEAKNNTVTVTYSNAGTITRVFASEELMTSQQEYKETVLREIDGKNVTLSIKDGNVYTAAWIENYNSYLIELNPVGEGVSEEDIALYISATE